MGHHGIVTSGSQESRYSVFHGDTISPKFPFAFLVSLSCPLQYLSWLKVLSPLKHPEDYG